MSILLKGLDLGKFSIYPPIVLAPMAGYTDSNFRMLVKYFGAGLVFTEMISSDGLYAGDRNNLKLMKYKEAERPIAAQFFGSNIDRLVYAAKLSQDWGFDIICLNMGCPSQHIMKSGGGAELLKNPVLVSKILHSLRNATTIPLSVKVRKGFYEGENLLPLFSKIFEEEGVDLVIVHGISVEEGFNREREDWQCIKEFKNMTHIPVIGNGGISNVQDVERMFTETGADGVMVGRAVLSCPWFIKSATDYIENGKIFSLSLMEKFNIIVRFIESIDEGKQMKEIRKLIYPMIFGLRGTKSLRIKLEKTQSKEEIKGLLKAFFESEEAQ